MQSSALLPTLIIIANSMVILPYFLYLRMQYSVLLIPTCNNIFNCFIVSHTTQYLHALLMHRERYASSTSAQINNATRVGASANLPHMA